MTSNNRNHRLTFERSLEAQISFIKFFLYRIERHMIPSDDFPDDVHKWFETLVETVGERGGWAAKSNEIYTEILSCFISFVASMISWEFWFIGVHMYDVLLPRFGLKFITLGLQMIEKRKPKWDFYMSETFFFIKFRWWCRSIFKSCSSNKL